MHNPDFQALESAWRGLHFLVNNTETDEMLKIRVLNVSKKELHKTLKRYKGTNWDQSPIFKRIYEQEFGQLGGEPYGCLVGDYYFDHSGPDVELLGEMAKIAAATHAPFISGTAPGTTADAVLERARQPARPHQDLHDARVRELAVSTRIRGRALPRPGHAPLPRAAPVRGPRRTQIEEFDFEEETTGADSDKYCWANAATTRWRSTSIGRSRCMAGARAFVVSNPAEPSKACPRIPSPPMTVVSI